VLNIKLTVVHDGRRDSLPRITHLPGRLHVQIQSRDPARLAAIFLKNKDVSIVLNVFSFYISSLKKGMSLESKNCIGKIAASVLLELFINGYKDAP